MALFLLTGGVRAGDVFLVGDFDQTSPETFSFKDEKGSLLNASGAYPDEAKGKVLGIRYDVLPEGFGGWGVAMKGADVSKFRYLAFDLRGEKGGELFEVGLRDAKGQEKKKGIGGYIDTPVKWQRVFIPLAEFSGVNLTSLDNISLGFVSKQKGRIFLDNISFEGSAESGGSAASGDVANKIVVDGFDRANAESAYRSFAGDGSTRGCVLFPCHIRRGLFHGDSVSAVDRYALGELGFRGDGCRLSLMDWTGVDTVKVWVKGDGSDNYPSVSVSNKPTGNCGN
jgi:hypothetical protein